MDEFIVGVQALARSEVLLAQLEEWRYSCQLSAKKGGTAIIDRKCALQCIDLHMFAHRLICVSPFVQDKDQQGPSSPNN